MELGLIVSSVLLWTIVLFNLLLTIGLMRRANKEARPQFPEYETLPIGDTTPDFEAELLDGQTVTLANYAQRSLLMIFMSMTCAPCVEKLPQIRDLATVTSQSGVWLLLIFRESGSVVREFANEHSLNMPILIVPPPNQLWRKYKVPGTPFYYRLNEDNVIVEKGFLAPDFALSDNVGMK